MRVSDFDFDLPEDRIALEPARPRDAARLLHVAPDALHDRGVRDLPELLRPGDALVLNDTKVIPAQLFGYRTRVREGSAIPSRAHAREGGHREGLGPRLREDERGDALTSISATLIKRLDASRWLALAKPGRRIHTHDRLHFGHEGTACLQGALDATVEAKGDEGEIVLAFDLAGVALDEAIAAVGVMPLPPYIAGRRPATDSDRRDYQTVYAREEGAVAAPTAGLHFTDDLFARLDARGAARHFVTLHIGAGTFLPVKVEDTRDHKMHAEWGEVSPDVADALNETRERGGRIVAVGTTSLRLLEAAADESGRIRPFAGETSIFITPGYRFRAVDMLMTNFHLPRSTLFMLVCAFAGTERMKAAYAHAIAAGYRFYSYGDACLLERAA